MQNKKYIKSQNKYFQKFKTSINSYSIPKKFNFPFEFEPNELSKLAAYEIQESIDKDKKLKQKFNIDNKIETKIIGKMFGVLVVKNKLNEIGYLKAFSGKLINSSTYKDFVPPIYSRFSKTGFFLKEEQKITKINLKIKSLEKNSLFLKLKQRLKNEIEKSKKTLSILKKNNKEAKVKRKILRQEAKNKLNSENFQLLLKKLEKQSIKNRIHYKTTSIKFKNKIEKLQNKIEKFNEKISKLKIDRKNKSESLQEKLFNQYEILNSLGEKKGLFEIFKNTVFKKPPSGAGDCALPKLLQYAYLNEMTPITSAEFWWGPSPKQEIRRHKYFYPACRGKCGPILSHMLKGIKSDKNPLKIQSFKNKIIKIIFEDEYILVINKPHEFLSVPGIDIHDSVAIRIQKKYPKIKGPLIVHRLDMSTSGVMLIAKSKEIHNHLQNQFLKRTVKKRYIALLDGILDGDKGIIDLPIRMDYINRPRQIVCHEKGKTARTEWKVIKRYKNKTKVFFYPITGRTHQLRVHAAHPNGLNIPIIGDDLYGIKSDRLYLHANSITITHPNTKEIMTFQVPPDF